MLSTLSTNRYRSSSVRDLVEETIAPFSELPRIATAHARPVFRPLGFLSGRLENQCRYRIRL
jgi:hypothetical protein